MESKKEKVLFLVDPGQKHLIVELDESYNRKELAVLLSAFRKRLTAEGGRSGKTPVKAVNRIVGPGFVIEMLGRNQAV